MGKGTDEVVDDRRRRVVAVWAFGFKPEHLDEVLMYRAKSTLWLRSRQAWSLKVYKYMEIVHERATRGHGGRQ